MKRSLFLFMLALLCGITEQAYSQRSVTGVVTGKADGAPIAGVNIVVRGSGTGSITDSEGKFALQVPPEATTLVFSFIGFVTQEVAIPESNYLAISLESNVSELLIGIIIFSLLKAVKIPQEGSMFGLAFSRFKQIQTTVFYRREQVGI